jgi:Protein of unknown function (DUF1552)
MSNPMTAKEAAAQRAANLSRRRFLRGVGACMALPAFGSLMPSRAFAAGASAAGGSTAAAATASGAPLRMAFIYFPNGAHQANWWPSGEGRNFQLGKTMQPLEKVKQQVQILTGMDQVNALPGPDGAGDHARASGTFLTGMRARKTAGANIQVGVSIDQLVAQKVGHLTRFPSLELTCDSVRKSGNCDSGYSCAYQYNLSWSTPSTPVAPEPNPRLVFERLFGAGAQGQRQQSFKARQAQQKSVLDFVMEDAGALERQLASNDRRKLDEYLTSVREIEKRIERAERFKDTPDPDADTPPGIPPSFPEYIGIMFDMLLLAFQTDSTRVATFLLANEGSNRAFPEIGIPEGHHYLSHHRGKEEMLDKIAQIDAFYMKQLARFFEKMESTRDVDGKSLLHNSMIVYGCGNGDGNRHTHTNLPVLLAGGGGGAFTPGRYNKLSSQPMSNLLLSMAERMGVSGLPRFGDSTGRLTAV